MARRLSALLLAALAGLALIACAAAMPEEHPCDRASSGPRVAPPWDGADALAGMKTTDPERCGVEVTASTEEGTLQRECADHSKCGEVCVLLSRVRRARLRAAEITQALNELHARLEALPPSSPCVRALAAADSGYLSEAEATAFTACIGITVPLPGLVVFLKDGKLEQLAMSVQLMPHGETIMFRAAMFPVDCSPPEWAVDRTPP